MKRRWFLNALLILPIGAAGYAFSRQGKLPVEMPLMPPQAVIPETAANRALLVGVQRNDPKAVTAAFEQGASPNASVVFPNYEVAIASPRENSPKRPSPKPVPICFLIDPMLANSMGSFSRQNEEANRQRSIAIFRQFLERGVDPKTRDEGGTNLVFRAMMLEDVDLLRLAFDKGGDTGALTGNPAVGPSGNPVNFVLMMTIRGKEEKSLPLLSLVLERGADPNLYDGSGLTPLHSACLIGLPKTAKILLQHGANPSQFTQPQENKNSGGRRFPHKATPIMLAARSGNTEIIRMLTAAKPNLSAEEAVMIGDTAALRKYLASGMNPNQKDEKGNPYVVLAAASGVPEAVQLLLNHKADPNARGAGGATALRRAAILGHGAVVRALLRAGADPNAVSGRSEFPETALTAAIQAAEPDCVNALLASPRLRMTAPGNRDALLRSVQNAGMTLLRPIGKSPQSVKRGDAALDAQSDIYATLVERVDVRKIGGPALCLAVDKGQFGIAEDLLQRGADVNARDWEGKTVLMLTVKTIGMNLDSVLPDSFMGEDLTPAEKKVRRAEVQAQNKKAMAFLRLLLRKKPNVNAVSASDDDTENTALAIARFWKATEAAALLKRAGARR